MTTEVPVSSPVTWHDVVDGTAGMIPNPMYGRRADLPPTPQESRGLSCKAGKTSCVLWACLGTAAMLICVTGKF
ncbi:Hypp7200 [Branchiostoma lanceolatum]|uniref:Hypp7200 protein n=1 Tax=Branchiostoma lanceolatum TaxID=7740 RepID=A0A8J9YY69_BRALA|nr:Hypp7200 [Branchiostoma lanceolatum]